MRYVTKPGYLFIYHYRDDEERKECELILKKTPHSRKGKTIMILVPPSKAYGIKIIDKKDRLLLTGTLY